MRFMLLALFLFLMAACREEESSIEPPECGAEELQDLVGGSASEQEFPEGTRIIGPNTPVTMDFNPKRLNVETDEADVITRIYCG